MRNVARNGILEPDTVISLTAHAVMTSDKFLAAQIMSRLGTLPKQARGLGFVLRQALESVILGDDGRRARNAIAIARQRS